jgi:prophage regulatory protein
MNTLQPTPEHLQLLKLRQVMKLTCLARSTVYKYCADNSFPKPVKLGERSVAWVESEVREWIEQKMFQRVQLR